MERVLRDTLEGGRFQGVPEAQTRRMRAIKATGARSTERRLRALLVRHGVRGWVVHPPGLAGKPDFLFAAARLVVWVDGCYWHGCPQCNARKRRSVNKAYWSLKIEGNRRRDEANTQKLQEAGYRV